ncbi:MAG: hypothetical protein R3D63_14050 [Paracoccaceae bacterium]
MQRIFLAGFVAMTVAACVPEGQGGSAGGGGGQISISSGGSFSGGHTTTVYADDRIEVSTSGPFGEGAQSKVSAGRLGVFAEVSAVIAAEGPAVARAVNPASPACEDYGADTVSASPAINGFSSVAATCPDDRVQAFQNRLVAVISGR